LVFNTGRKPAYGMHAYTYAVLSESALVSGAVSLDSASITQIQVRILTAQDALPAYGR